MANSSPDQTPDCPHPRETRCLFGHDPQQAQFLSAWRGERLHHAWLLQGPKGIGKATFAYQAARALIAHAQPGGDLPGIAPVPFVPSDLDVPRGCPVQARIIAGAEPCLAVLGRTHNARTGKLRKDIVVEDIRAIRGFLSLSAADGGWRCIIIDSADDLNVASGNALLKLLEEPPRRSVFFLVSHRPSGLLATIRSRCRMLNFRPLAPEPMARALEQAGIGLSPALITALQALAGGTLGQALVLGLGDGMALYARLLAVLDGGHGVHRAKMMALANGLNTRDAQSDYAMLVLLVQILLSRLAHAAATQSFEPAIPEEAALFKTLAQNPGQAHLWAEALQRISATLRHAIAVNLDPGQTIIDTLLDIDAVMAQSRHARQRNLRQQDE